MHSKALLCSVEAGWDDIMIMTHMGLALVNFNVGKQTLTAFRFPGRSLWVCLGRAAEQKLLYTFTRNLKCWKWGWKASPRTRLALNRNWASANTIPQYDGRSKCTVQGRHERRGVVALHKTASVQSWLVMRCCCSWKMRPTHESSAAFHHPSASF